jgi:hypothetical protein
MVPVSLDKASFERYMKMTLSAGLELEFVVVAGSSFDEAFDSWGSTLLKYHGKQSRQESIISKYLGEFRSFDHDRILMHFYSLQKHHQKCT